MTLARPANAIRPNEAALPTGKGFQRGGPRPEDLVALRRPTVERRLNGSAETDVALDHPAVGQIDPEPLPGWVRMGRGLHKASDDDSVNEEAAFINQVEASILRDSVLRDENVGRMFEAQASDGGDGEPRDRTHEPDPSPRPACRG